MGVARNGEKMILVTGAGGKTGRAVVSALAARGAQVRAFVRRAQDQAALRELGARDVVAGDLRQAADLERAAQGVRALYHICPNVHPDEVLIGRLAIAAAQAAGVEHFVFHSVLHPQTESMPHHWNKLRVEEAAVGLRAAVYHPAASALYAECARWLAGDHRAGGLDRALPSGDTPEPGRPGRCGPGSGCGDRRTRAPGRDL